MPASTAPVAWIDVETSALSPSTGDLLEIAAVVTSGPHYTPVDDGVSAVIHPHRFEHLSPREAVEQMKQDMPAVVIEMHTNTGLFDDIEAGRTVSLADADLLVRDYLARHFEPRGAVLGGNSITLDRNFLEVFAPRTFGHLHYRSLDCTSVAELVRRLPWIDSDLYLSPPVEGTAHRAMSDVRASIAQAQLLSEMLRPSVWVRLGARRVAARVRRVLPGR